MGFTVPGFKSLVHSEHSFRQAVRERGILDLGMMRIDVRCAALESISTQSTLIAGFAFSSLAPDVLDTLKREADDTLVDILFAMVFVGCTAASFAASIWVIYMALYAGYKAQFTALQGRSSVAVSTALAILLRTNDRIAEIFNMSLAFLGLAAMLLAFVHLHFIAFLTLTAVFGYFIYDGYTFQKSIDADFDTITHFEEDAQHFAQATPSPAAQRGAAQRSYTLTCSVQAKPHCEGDDTNLPAPIGVRLAYSIA